MVENWCVSNTLKLLNPHSYTGHPPSLPQGCVKASRVFLRTHTTKKFRPCGIFNRFILQYLMEGAGLSAKPYRATPLFLDIKVMSGTPLPAVSENDDLQQNFSSSRHLDWFIALSCSLNRRRDGRDGWGSLSLYRLGSVKGHLEISAVDECTGRDSMA